MKNVQLDEPIARESKADDEMEVSDEDDQPMRKKRRGGETLFNLSEETNNLKEENDNLKCQIEAYKNEVCQKQNSQNVPN